MNENYLSIAKIQPDYPFSQVFSTGRKWIGRVSSVFSPLAKAINLHQQDSLNAWILIYFKIHVMGAPVRTQQAKQRDLERFMGFYMTKVGNENVDGWTPAVTKQFQDNLQETISIVTGKAYSQSTVIRTMATLKHFGRWLQQQRPFLTGDPFKGVKDRQLDEPNWNGLSAKQILILKAACEARARVCSRRDQNPHLEIAVFYMLLLTGLRGSELVALNVEQYHHQGLHQVIRHKSKRVTARVPVPGEAREYLEQYLEVRGRVNQDEPLFVSRYGNRLAAQDVRRICHRMLGEAKAYVSDEENFRFTPHMLRHTFLKQVADKHGVHFAQQMSGNVSIREIFRYAKPSQQEMDNLVEGLF